jgi:hypothetical protein
MTISRYILLILFIGVFYVDKCSLLAGDNENNQQLVVEDNQQQEQQFVEFQEQNQSKKRGNIEIKMEALNELRAKLAFFEFDASTKKHCLCERILALQKQILTLNEEKHCLREQRQVLCEQIRTLHEELILC